MIRRCAALTVPGILAIAFGLVATESAAQEAPEPHIILERAPDFFPSFDLQMVSDGRHLFLPGSTPDVGGDVDAALVARDVADGQEVWRVTRGEPGLRDRFHKALLARGLVCASGVGSRAGPEVIFVGCYSGRSGDPIWEKEIASPTLFFPNHELEVVGRSLLIRIASQSNPFLLRFDLFDGSP